MIKPSDFSFSNATTKSMGSFNFFYSIQMERLMQWNVYASFLFKSHQICNQSITQMKALTVKSIKAVASITNILPTYWMHEQRNTEQTFMHILISEAWLKFMLTFILANQGQDFEILPISGYVLAVSPQSIAWLGLFVHPPICKQSTFWHHLSCRPLISYFFHDLQYCNITSNPWLILFINAILIPHDLIWSEHLVNLNTSQWWWMLLIQCM